MHKVAVIVGSIRKDSINRKYAAALAKLAEGKLAFAILRIDDLPLFNQDDEANPAPAVVRLKDEIAGADAVLFVAPEHNRSIPAAMKNAIDWATRPPAKNAFRGKVGAVTGTSRGGIATAVAQQHLRTILAAHLTAILGSPEAYLQFKDGLIDEAGNVTDETTRKFLQTFVDNLAQARRGDGEAVATMPVEPAQMDTTVDPAEIAKFERMAAEWWDPDGKFRPLHKFNPVRLAYVRDVVVEHFGRDPKGGRPLSGLRLLDIGCGGGLLAEPMARLGATTVGVDPSVTNVGVARRHAERSGLAVDYRATTAEALVDAGERFDVVLAMEVVEHVANIDAFLAAGAALVKPGGLLFVATINRTTKAFALAIVGAEYLLRWLPRGTHDYSKLVRPAELEAALTAAGLSIVDQTGVRYNPLSDRWSRAADMDVNYMVVATKDAG